MIYLYFKINIIHSCVKSYVTPSQSFYCFNLTFSNASVLYQKVYMAFLSCMLKDFPILFLLDQLSIHQKSLYRQIFLYHRIFLHCKLYLFSYKYHGAKKVSMKNSINHEYTMYCTMRYKINFTSKQENKFKSTTSQISWLMLKVYY